MMTAGPMVTGYHEPDVLSVLAFLARSGFDQGTDRRGGQYRSDDLSLPNSVRNVSLLRTESAGVQRADSEFGRVFGPELHLHNFGLGEQDETSVLSIPHTQPGWGIHRRQVQCL